MTNERTEFKERREAERPVKVVSVRQHIRGLIAFAAFLGVSVPAVTMWAARQFIREEIRVHDLDANAHPVLTRAVQTHVALEQNGQEEVKRQREALDRLADEVRQVREDIARLEGFVRRTRSERTER